MNYASNSQSKISKVSFFEKHSIERRVSRRESLKLALEPKLLEKRLYEACAVFDSGKSGEIDVRELDIIIRALGCIVTEAELQEIQVQVEDVENNCVPIHKFVDYMYKAINENKFKPAEPEDILKAFKLLDPENRGYIMKDDLQKILMQTGEPFTKDEINDMMSVACEPETERIYYEYYINLLIVKIPEDLNVYSLKDLPEAPKTVSPLYKYILEQG